MKYYSRECINYSRDRKITCGNEILLAGIQYYSRKWIITRGKKYYSRERIITRGNLFITRGNDILLAGEKYWQYMAPEGFRNTPLRFRYQDIPNQRCNHWSWTWISNKLIPHFTGCVITFVCMLGFELNHASKWQHYIAAFLIDLQC